MQNVTGFHRYWGKTTSDTCGGPSWHLLCLHCLDVAAVLDAWLEADAVLRDRLVGNMGGDGLKMRAWTLFFAALHDLGKFDIRFQLAAPELAARLNPVFISNNVGPFDHPDHGQLGYAWFLRERYGVTGRGASQWMVAACGHHGYAPVNQNPSFVAESVVKDHDRQARHEWVAFLRKMLLEPAGIMPEELAPAVPELFAGCCCVSDWLGSNTDFFPLVDAMPASLVEYFQSRRGGDYAGRALATSGLLPRSVAATGMGGLYPSRTPRSIQRLVEDLPVQPGLTLIEAPTGCGKTEAAVAYASRLLAGGLADGIIFAMPTQATANAMLVRLEETAGRMFSGGANLVLAHGKSRHHPMYRLLRDRAVRPGLDNSDAQGLTQCAQWLAQSRKRVFLGQIGVCTIDQVLLSVLPVRHSFVRRLGVGRNVLIVDEVHAYDSYMNGLLDEVLRYQRLCGGSAILLSATLPQSRREELLSTWFPQAAPGKELAAYPLVSHAGLSTEKCWTPDDRPPEKIVSVRVIESSNMSPNQEVLAEIVQKAQAGQRVAVICNLVADAQALARQLGALAAVPVDLFHSRFRFRDRQVVEQRVLADYGPDAPAGQGRILVATQVVEQSLDLDFDWMVTQLCPIDLLFQRLGRLHRHDRPRVGPPQCVVLVPAGIDYGLHGLIYGDLRVLWRTQQLLGREGLLRFPAAYRPCIEAVYAQEPQPDEPSEVLVAHEEYVRQQGERRAQAMRLCRQDVSPWSDKSEIAASLTRGDEMSLTVIPLEERGESEYFLGDDMPLSSLPNIERDEQMDLNSISVPHSWARCLPSSADGTVRLLMEDDPAGGWAAMWGKTRFRYTTEFGLEKENA